MILRAGMSGFLAGILILESCVAFLPSPRAIADTHTHTLASDSDPYFLGSQSWRTASDESDAPSIPVPGVSLFLQVKQPLVQLQEVGEWIFFAAQEGSALDEEGAQGLYFIRTREFYQSALKRAPVPFFYLPLPGSAHEYAGSHARPELLELPEQQAIVIRDRQGVSFALPIEDLAGYEAQATRVLQIASLTTLEKQVQWWESPDGQKALEPVRERLWQNMQEMAGQSAPQGVVERALELAVEALPEELRDAPLPEGATRFHGLVPRLSRFFDSKDSPWDFFPLAHAGDSQALQVAAHAALVIANCSLFYTAGVLLKHSLLKQRMGDVQTYLMRSGPALASGIIEEFVSLIQTGASLDHKRFRRARKIIDEIQQKLPKWKATRDQQLLRTLKRVKNPNSAREQVLVEWDLLENVVARASGVLLQGEQTGPVADTEALDRVLKQMETIVPTLKKASGHWMEFRSNVAAFGHVLTFMAQIPSVAAPHLFRYILDRAGLAEHSAFRQLFFEPSFGYSQKSSESTPIDSTTVMLGTGVLNVVDTANVAIELYAVNPLLGRAMGAVMPPGSWKTRLLDVFGQDNPDTDRYNLITLLVNTMGYIAVGAYMVAHDQQEFLTQIYDREVRREFQERGAVIGTHETEQLIQQEIRARVRFGMQMRGFPTEDEFLFDVNSTRQGLLSLTGLGSIPGIKSGDHAQARPGRIPEVLNRAIERAHAQKDLEVEAGLRAIQEHNTLLRPLWKMAHNPSGVGTLGEKLNDLGVQYKRSRRELVALTLGVSQQQATEFLAPFLASRFGGEQAALRAWSLVRSEWEDLLRSTPKDAEEVKEAGFDFETQMNPELRLGWYGRAQVNRSAKKADLAVTVAQESSEKSQAELDELWLSAFRSALEYEMGLRIDRVVPDPEVDKLLSIVSANVKKAWNERLSHPDFAHYYAQLSPLRQRRLRGLYEAEFFVNAYVESTVTEGVVSPLSAAQPGLFQALRQKTWVKKSRALTRVLRFFEGTVSDQRFQLGFWRKVGRTVPLVDDIWVSGIRRNIRRFPVALGLVMPWGYAVWGASYVPSLFVLNFAVAGLTVNGPWTAATRALNNIGVKPGSTVGGMVGLATLGSWVCMLGMWMTPLLAPTVQPYLKPVDQLAEKIGYLVKSTDPKTHETRFEIAPHPLLEKCKDLLRPALNSSNEEGKEGGASNALSPARPAPLHMGDPSGGQNPPQEP